MSVNQLLEELEDEFLNTHHEYNTNKFSPQLGITPAIRPQPKKEDTMKRHIKRLRYGVTLSSVSAGSAMAAVPATVTTALSDALSDSTTVAAAVIAIIVALLHSLSCAALSVKNSTRGGGLYCPPFFCLDKSCLFYTLVTHRKFLIQIGVSVLAAMATG